MAQAQSQVKRINRQNRTVEMEDGRTIPLPDDLAFEMLGSEAGKEKKKGMAEAVRSVHGAVSSIPGGESTSAFASSAGESSFFPKIAENFLDFVGEGVSSIKKGKGQEGMGYFERWGEGISALRSGRSEAKQQISAKNPTASALGTGAGIATDILMPIKGLPKSPIKQGAAMGGLYGLASDKNILQDPLGVAKDVGIGAGLGAGIGAAGSKLEKIASERASLRNYPELLQKHKEATTKAEKQYLAEMARKLDAVNNDLRGGISKSSVDVDGFINTNIGMSPIAGTPEAKNLGNFFSSLIKSAPENMDAADLKRIFHSIETKAATAAAEEIPMFTAFKSFLVDSLPVGAAQNAVKTKYGQRLFNSFEKQVDKSVNKFLSDKTMINDLRKFVGKDTVDGIATDLKRFSKSGYDKLTPAEFAQDLQSGNLQDRMMWFVDNNQKLSKMEDGIDNYLQKLQNFAPLAQLRSPEVASLLKAKNEIQAMKQAIRTNLDNAVSSNSLAASIYERDVLQKVSSKISNAVGVQNPMSNVKPTNAKPVAAPPPGAPQVGRMASYFETPNFYSSKLKKFGNMRGTGGIAKAGYLGGLMMGVPKAMAAATLGTGAAAMTSALRGMTSPTALGAVARQGIQRGSIRLIVESIAEKYPSYQNGVLGSPEERRSAVAEIEQDPDVGLEDKAMLQAKINRGQSIERLIKE